jgi:hypothetical protein
MILEWVHHQVEGPSLCLSVAVVARLGYQREVEVIRSLSFASKNDLGCVQYSEFASELVQVTEWHCRSQRDWSFDLVFAGRRWITQVACRELSWPKRGGVNAVTGA